MASECRICGVALPRGRGTFYPGFGRLCDDCDDRADVVTNHRGHFVRATMPPQRRGGRQ